MLTPTAGSGGPDDEVNGERRGKQAVDRKGEQVRHGFPPSIGQLTVLYLQHSPVLPFFFLFPAPSSVLFCSARRHTSIRGIDENAPRKLGFATSNRSEATPLTLEPRRVYATVHVSHPSVPFGRLVDPLRRPEKLAGPLWWCMTARRGTQQP